MSSNLGCGHYDDHSPCTWWDRSCDVALLVGSFIHGLGNYEAMRNNDELPFKAKIEQQAVAYDACATAHGSFIAAAGAARKLFDSALGSAKSKEQERVRAAVYAASKNEGGDSKASAGAAKDPSAAVPDVPPPISADPDDTHLVTLDKLSESMRGAARACFLKYSGPEADVTMVDAPAIAAGSVDTEADVQAQLVDANEPPIHKRLPMPDSRVLDGLLVRLIGHLEGDTSPRHVATNETLELQWEMGNNASAHEKARSTALEQFFCLSKEQVEGVRRDFIGIGFNGAQCASTHRSLDDGSDYSMGAASPELAQVAIGTDAPRYLRTVGVPMNLTRYAASALMYADAATLQTMLNDERERMTVAEDGKAAATGEAGPATTTNADSKGNKDSATKDSKPRTDESEGVNTFDMSLEEQLPEKPTSAAKADSSSVASQQQQLLPMVPTIDAAFRDNAAVRAGLCAAVLHFGLPTVGGGTAHVDAAILGELSRQLSSAPVTSPPQSLFTLENLCSQALSVMDGVSMPPVDSIQRYCEAVLLPHCLRLCVMGNGPSTRNARGSEGKFETACGFSNYPDCSKSRQTPLPDPCATLAEHSIEAVACASAILRRARLMRATHYIVSGGVSLVKLTEMLQSPAVRDSMDDLPVWWCPQIHDLALLVHAATRGIFSILVDRKLPGGSSIFSLEAIKQHIQTRFISQAATSSMFDGASPDDVSAWLEQQAQDFPSVNTMERRLGLLCSVATAHLRDDMNRYDALPMWDHGAWPRK